MLKSLQYSSDYGRDIRNYLLTVKDLSARRGIPNYKLEPTKCSVCNHHTDNLPNLLSAFNLAYTRCSTCGYISRIDTGTPCTMYIDNDPIISRYFALRKKYAHVIDEFLDLEYNQLLVSITRFLPHAGELLDIGAGNGSFLRSATSHGFSCTAIEPNKILSQAYTWPFFPSIEHAVASGKKYDVITCNQLLYTIRDPRDLFRSISSLLNPGGLVSIYTPSSTSLASILFRGRSTHLDNVTTYSVHSIKSIEHLFSISSLRTLSKTTHWIDCSFIDIVLSLFGHPRAFLHKRNFHVPGYSRLILIQDLLLRISGLEYLLTKLLLRGNYLHIIGQKVD